MNINPTIEIGSTWEQALKIALKDVYKRQGIVLGEVRFNELGEDTIAKFGLHDDLLDLLLFSEGHYVFDGLFAVAIPECRCV